MEDEPNQDQQTQRPEEKGLSGFFAELKRRKVVRVGLVYLAVGWLVIQVASSTFSDFGIPDWAYRFVVLMVALGFPLAVILAWAFELTPEGVKPTAAVGQADSGRSKSFEKKRNWTAIAFAAGLPTLIFGTLSLIFYFGVHTDSGSASSGAEQVISPDRPYYIGSLAVLPFTVIGGDESVRNTAEGLHEEVLTAFAEMGPLDVISRSSVMQYREERPTIPEMGKALGADFIIEGSIQAVADRLRVTLQLIEASTDNHMWAQTFDRGEERFDYPLRFQKELAFELSFRSYRALKAAHPPTGKALELLQQVLEEKDAQLEEYINNFFGIDGQESDSSGHAKILTTLDEMMRLEPDNEQVHRSRTDIIRFMLNRTEATLLDPDYRRDYYLALKRAEVSEPKSALSSLRFYYWLFENNPHKALDAINKQMMVDVEEGRILEARYYGQARYNFEVGQIRKAMRILEGMPADTQRTGDEGYVKLSIYSANRAYPELIENLTRRIVEISAIAEKDNRFERKLVELEATLAVAEAFWTGARDPIIQYVSKNPDVSERPHYVIELIYWTALYERIVEHIADLPKLDPLRVPEYRTFLIRGFAYQKLDNTALAQSYLKASLKSMEESLRGKWAQQYEPDILFSQKAICLALMGENELAEEAINTALEKVDIIRHYMDYFDTLYAVATAKALIGDVTGACELIDQVLSNPFHYTTGRILIDPMLEDLHSEPAFQAVIRKHADQLKDPAVLEKYFGAN